METEMVDAEEWDNIIKVVNQAHKIAKEQGLGVGHAGVFTFKCPVCNDGRITCSVASINGHIHGNCNTDKCVRFME